ncbi:MAG: glutamate racemase [Candidatus Eremiobacteraeota bacterium]|nr:glutamate racemase [Candidatus Eremiobacteraeota bacterium]
MLDSGLGGLTVLAALRAVVGAADVVYLADTANVPYGGRTLADVARLGYAAIELLLRSKPSIIVVASGTTCAAFDACGWPKVAVAVVGVVEPGAAAAVSATRNGRIGVVATHATVASGVFKRSISALRADADVHSVEAPSLVPIVESGRWATVAARDAVAIACAPLLGAGCDTVILGCTHFPHLRAWFSAVFGPSVQIVDPGAACAYEAGRLLEAMPPATGTTQFIVSGDAAAFGRNARALCGIRIDRLSHVDMVPALKPSGTA